MAKVVTTYGNFAKAKIDHDMSGRFDLPIYNTSADVFQNFISNFKGNAIFSAGFLSQLTFQDCAFIEFKFGNTQNYLCCFFANKIRFAAFDTNGVFGWVLDGSSAILEVATPYTLAQCKTLDYTQNNDVMVVTCSGFEPRKLIRTSANAFTFNVFARNNDPFPTSWQSGKTITGVTAANPAVVTATGHSYTTGDRVLFANIVGMTQLNGYTATVTVINANSFSIDLDTSAFSAYGSGGIAQKVLAGDYPACCLFYKGRLYYAATPLKGTKVWFSTAGVYDDYTAPVTFTDISAFNFVIADITQAINWLFPGDNSLIAGASDGIVAINGGAVNTAITAATVQANITSAEPCNQAYPFKKDGLIFYVGRNNRNVYYFSYDLLTESFLSKDANLISYDITKGGFSKLRYKKDRDDLIFALRGDGDYCSINFKQSENIIGWHERETEGLFIDIGVIADNNGDPQYFALVNRGGTFYIEQQANYVEFAERSDFLTTDQNDDDEAYSRLVGEQLRNCVYLDGSLTFNDLHTTTITYDPMGGTLTAGGSSFSSGDVGKHVSYKTATGYESGRFEITGYVSATVVDVTVLQEPKAAVGAPLYVWSAWYKSFMTLSGLDQFNGTTVGVVTDGGYLDDFAVSGGAITFDQQTCSVVVGYKYTGIIKTFCLGFQFQGQNTQTTLKNISRVGVRCVASAGIQIGSTPYHMEDVQELSQNDINYLPPLPIDGTKYIDYFDESEEDKFLYIIQPYPLPAHICNVPVECNYASSS